MLPAVSVTVSVLWGRAAFCSSYLSSWCEPRHRQHAGNFLDGVAQCSISWLKVKSHQLCSLDSCWTNGASGRHPSQQSRGTGSPCKSTGSSQELLGQLCSLHEFGMACKINLTVPVDLNKLGEAWGCRGGIVMLLPHCSHDYCNRRQRHLLRTNSRFFTLCHLISTGPSWCSVETSHPSAGKTLNNQMSLLWENQWSRLPSSFTEAAYMLHSSFCAVTRTVREEKVRF